MTAFVAEIWTWYTLTWLVVAARLISRRLLFGEWKKMQIEDYVMILAMVTDTILLAAMSVIVNTSSNLINPNDHIVLDAKEIKERVFGSKLVLVVEQMQIITVWTTKCCLLLMYNRLTMSLKQNVAVKIVAGYVIFGLVLMEILYFGVWCRPFHEYWAVPTSNRQCSAATNHLITNAVLNISSDLMIICIPMPVFLKSQLALKRKLILVGVFALGSFTILSAILNKFYSFSQPYGSEWTYWYIRESSTALITANLPYTWTLLRRVFNIGSFNESSAKRSTNPSTNFRSDFRSGHHHSTLRSTARGGDGGGTLHRLDSEEQINSSYAMPLKIYQRHEVEIKTEQATDEDGQIIPPGAMPQDLGGKSVIVTSAVRDEETSSERSINGAVKAFHGV